MALDRVDQLAPGSGHLDLTGYLHGTGGVGSFGGALDYEHKITGSTSAFANAWAGGTWGDSGGLGFDYGALVGFRWTF